MRRLGTVLEWAGFWLAVPGLLLLEFGRWVTDRGRR